MLTVPGNVRLANAPDDCEQPGLDRGAALIVKTTLRANKALLDGILRVRPIA
jgi:hypothetical protein